MPPATTTSCGRPESSFCQFLALGNNQVLSGCASTELVVFARGAVPAAGAAAAGSPEAIAEWDDNGNGRISCAEARAHGIAPVTRDHPAYPFMRDGDGDGVVCESGSSRTSPANPRRPADSYPDGLWSVPQLHGVEARSSQWRPSWALRVPAAHGP